MALDSDQAGQKGRDRLITALAGRTMLQTLQIPQGKDITDHIVVHGGSITTLLASAQPIEAAVSPVKALRGSFDELIEQRTMKASEVIICSSDVRKMEPAIQLPCVQIDYTEPPTRDLRLHELPNTWRAKLNTRRYVYPAIAPVCELMLEAHKAGLLNAADTTAYEVIEAATTLERYISQATIRRGIAEALKAGFFADTAYLKSSYAITANNSPGRPEQRFGMVDRPIFQAVLERQIAARLIEKAIPLACNTVAPMREHLIEMFTNVQPVAADGEYAQYAALIEAQPEYARRMADARREFDDIRHDLSKLRSTPYPTPWRYANATEYKAGFVRALLSVAPDKEGKRVLACEIGASHGSLDNLLAKAGVAAEPHITNVEIFDTDALDQIFQRDPKTGYFTPVYDKKLDGRPAQLIIDGRLERLNRDTLSEARRVVEEGGDVFVRYQHRSTFEIVSERQPEPVQRQPRAEQSEKVQPEKLTKENPLLTRKPGQPHPVPFWGETYSPEYEAANLVKLHALIAHQPVVNQPALNKSEWLLSLGGASSITRSDTASPMFAGLEKKVAPLPAPAILPPLGRKPFAHLTTARTVQL